MMSGLKRSDSTSVMVATERVGHAAYDFLKYFMHQFVADGPWFYMGCIFEIKMIMLL